MDLKNIYEATLPFHHGYARESSRRAAHREDDFADRQGKQLPQDSHLPGAQRKKSSGDSGCLRRILSQQDAAGVLRDRGAALTQRAAAAVHNRPMHDAVLPGRYRAGTALRVIRLRAIFYVKWI
jgi:hypothetical protein